MSPRKSRRWDIRTECPESCERYTLPEPVENPTAPGYQRPARGTEIQSRSRMPRQLIDPSSENVEDGAEADDPRDIEEPLNRVSLEQMAWNNGVDVLDRHRRRYKLSALLSLFVLGPVADQPEGALFAVIDRMGFAGFRGSPVRHLWLSERSLG